MRDSNTETSQPEDALLPHRNRHDRCAIDHVGGAVAVAADVMAESSIVPVDENAVESGIDRGLGPAKDRLQQRWDSGLLRAATRVAKSSSVR